MAILHKVQQGEGMIRIAAQYGYTDYKVIWDDPKNAQLKKNRPNPELLFPGDILFVPEKRAKEEARGTTKTHQFQLKMTTKTLRIALEDENGQRLANVPYTIKIESLVLRGQTDGQGILQKEVPIDAVEGELYVREHLWPLQIGHLNPVDSVPDQGVSGVVARLRNLGYDPGPADGTLDDPKTMAAIKAFQHDHQLTEDGNCAAKSPTLAKLIEKHGC